MGLKKYYGVLVGIIILIVSVMTFIFLNQDKAVQEHIPFNYTGTGEVGKGGNTGF